MTNDNKVMNADQAKANPEKPMTHAEKIALAMVIKGMDEEQKRFITRVIPSEYMQDELKRRDEVANDALAKAWDVIHQAREGMSLNEMLAMIDELKSALKGA